MMTTAAWAEVTQTILHNPDRPDVPGNCLQAAVASVLRLPLDAVPHFATFVWWPAAMEFWARGRGLVVRNVSTATIPDRLCIAGGKSPRGVDHACVADGGRVVWDPHPSRAGLVSVDEVWWFEPWTAGEGCWACGRPREGCAARHDVVEPNGTCPTGLTLLRNRSLCW